jgi:hypothetical protein
LDDACGPARTIRRIIDDFAIVTNSDILFDFGKHPDTSGYQPQRPKHHISFYLIVVLYAQSWECLTSPSSIR